MHEALSHPNPDFSHSMVMLQQTVCGVWSVLSKEGGDQCTCLPITLELLLKFRKVWEKDAGCFDINYALGSMYHLLFGFFRAGEIITPSTRTFSMSDHLAFSDVVVDCMGNPRVLCI